MTRMADVTSRLRRLPSRSAIGSYQVPFELETSAQRAGIVT